jgi:proton glutamate symport protein
MKKLWTALNQLTLTHWIFVSLFGGLILGIVAPQAALSLKPLRTLFLNGIKCIIMPLIFSTLVSGIAGTGSFKKLGVMGLRSLVYFELVTTLALVVGLAFVNVLQPGKGVHIGTMSPELAQKAAETQLSLGGFIEHLIPSNLADPILHGDVLQIVIFSTLFAFSVLAAGEKGQVIFKFCEGLSEVMFRFTGFVMTLAPLGVGAALAISIAEHGWQVIFPMLKLIGTLYAALIFFIAAVFLPILRGFKIPIKSFFWHIKDAVVLAFATTSSESAYPLALDSMERFGVPRRISSFVLPMGYSFNLDGSTLYLGIASVFIAQAAGIELSWGTQLAMMLSLMLTSKGVAAVPRATIVVLSGTLTAFGLPLEGVALIMAVDEFMDMARTAVNLLGNCLATAVISRTEGIELNTQIPETPTSESVLLNT